MHPPALVPAPTGNASPARHLWRRLPNPAQAAIVMLIGQIVVALLLTWQGHRHLTTYEHPRSFTDALYRWDAGWYRHIATRGYPHELPMVGDVVRQNPWAFYPLFPTLVGVLMQLTGLDFKVVGWLVSACCAIAAGVLFYQLLRPKVGHRIALWTLAALATFPSSVVLSLPYTDALGLLLVVCTLWALDRERLGLAGAALILAGLARPVGVPLAVVAFVHVVVLARQRRVGLRSLGLLVAAGMSAIEWPLIAAIVTGRPTAYTDSMAAWRMQLTLQPLRPWLDVPRDVFDAAWPVAFAALIVALIALVASLFTPLGRSLGLHLRVWGLAYVGYLLVFLFPSTSLMRYLIFFLPWFALIMAKLPGTGWRWAWLVLGVAGQWWWLGAIWFSPGNTP